MKMSSNVLLATASQLGEGLHWEAAHQRLWMVDIHGHRIIRWELGSRNWREWKTPQRVGWVLPSSRPDLQLAGLQGGMAWVRCPEQGEEVEVLAWLARPFPEGSSLRLNDAKTDRVGRVWAGSLDNADESRPLGRLFRIDTDGQCAEVDAPYCVANGPAISPCQSWMLHTDSAKRTIHAFDLDVEAGTLSNKRVWLQFSEADGYPDGMTFDAQGNVWIAHWGGACISRHDARGEETHRVSLPTAHVTNVCFGGPGLDRLFVTTAWQGLTDSQRAQQPLAGHTFEVDAAGSTGLAPTPVSDALLPTAIQAL